MEKRSDAQQKWNKEALFEDFVHSTKEVLPMFELIFGVKGVQEQFFGDFVDEEKRKAKVRSSIAWELLCNLYDYAIDGLEDQSGAENFIIESSMVIKFLTSENHQISREWKDIWEMGDARFGLGEGYDTTLERLALLANVDPRTVRNAISAGELEGEKIDQKIYIENAAARKWLSGRRGYKPTISPISDELPIESVDTPAKFGAFLKKRGQLLGLSNESKKANSGHPSLTSQSLEELESGLFNHSLDMAFPIADLYKINRKAFLACVMRVFFREQMQMLSETIISSVKPQ